MKRQHRDELALAVIMCAFLVAGLAFVAYGLEPLRRDEPRRQAAVEDDDACDGEGSMACTPTLDLDSGVVLEGPLSREQLADIVGVRSRKRNSR